MRKCKIKWKPKNGQLYILEQNEEAPALARRITSVQQGDGSRTRLESETWKLHAGPSGFGEVRAG